MDAESPLEAAKRLVRAVARAFYDDAAVAVLDALLRDRHLRDADMDQRMGGLSHKMVRRVLGELLEERLIKTEEVLDEASGKRELYYYVDFGHFTNVVRYRVHLMHREVERMEREANDNQIYECADCGRALSVLEAQPLRNRRFGFCCPTCCPNETHGGCEGERWQLRPKQVVAGFEEVQALKERLRRQMYAASADDGPAPHDGIYNLLSALERQPLPSNLPSELIAVGVAGGADDGDGARRRGGFGGGGGGGSGGGAAGIFENLAAATRDGGIHAMDDGDEGEGGGGGGTAGSGAAFLNVVRPARAQPEFLRGSRVIQEDQDHGSPSKAAAPGAAAAAGAVAGAGGHHEAGEALTEAQRIEAYKQAYMAALQKELAASNGGGGGGAAGASGGSPAGAAAAAVAATGGEEEEEDVDWEEGE